jgi:hypothetical protein
MRASGADAGAEAVAGATDEADAAGEVGIAAGPSMDGAALAADAALSAGRPPLTGFSANLAQGSSLSPEKTPRSGLRAESVT